MIPPTASPAPAARPDDGAAGDGADPGLAIAVFAADGNLSSRNPRDLALFGEVPAATSLQARIKPSADADTFLGRLNATRAASGVVLCRTSAGLRLLRVSAMRLAPQAAAAGPGFAEAPLQRGWGDASSVVTFEEQAGAEPPPVEHAPVSEAPPIPAERLARLGHELRSPLNAVLGFAEMIRQGAAVDVPPPPGRVAEYATDIVSAAWRLLRLADDLVALGETRSGAQFLRMGEVDLGRIVRRLIRLSTPAALAAHVRIDASFVPEGGEGPVVLGDEGALWSVVDNLLQNAIRYVGEEGTVRIGFPDAGPRGGVCLEVSDDGQGLTRAELVQALTPYGRPHEADASLRRPGGLGLPIARDLIEAHDGELEIDTAPGAGFTARVRFPPSRCLNW